MDTLNVLLGFSMDWIISTLEVQARTCEEKGKTITSNILYTSQVVASSLGFWFTFVHFLRIITIYYRKVIKKSSHFFYKAPHTLRIHSQPLKAFIKWTQRMPRLTAIICRSQRSRKFQNNCWNPYFLWVA